MGIEYRIKAPVTFLGFLLLSVQLLIGSAFPSNFFMNEEMGVQATGQKREGDPLLRCGTPSLLEMWRESGPRVLHVRPSLSGPGNILDTSHFKIHWTNSGSDSTTSSYVDSIAAYAEFCWVEEVDTLGWNSPPSDSFNHPQPESIGGDYRYDIYVINQSPGILGYVQAEHTVPSTPEEDATSYMVLDNNMSIPLLKVTVAHEFNHSCQFGHSFNENTGWYENTATWMEDQVYDGANEYYGFLTNSIVNPITFPEVKVTFFTGVSLSDSIFYAYGACTWPMLLHEWNGTQIIIREIWTLQGLHLGNFTMADIDSILRRDYSSDLETALKEYAVWRYFSGPNDDGQHYEEGGNWGAVPFVDPAHRHSSYPASGNEGSRGPDSLGVNFIRFDTTGFPGDLDLSFNGQNGIEWKALVISYDSLGTSRDTEIILDSNGDGSLSVNWNGFDHIALVPMVMTYTGTLFNGEYRTGNPEFTVHRSSFTIPVASTAFHPLQTFTYNATFVTSDSAGPVVNVVAANGGETWSIGEVEPIRWIATDSTFVADIDIFFSTNNGASWNTVALNEPNDSIYLWTIPNTPSDSCLLRIVAVDPWANQGEDTSDAVFFIGDFSPPQLTVLSPNGGENLAIGDTENITWTATDLFGVDSLTLELTINGGVQWSIFSRGELNDGNFAWEVPSSPSDSCLIRITAFDPSLNMGSDVSNNLFRISDQTPPLVIIITPNGGETWIVGTQDSIRWVAADLYGIDSLSLFISSDGGSNWIILSSGESNDSLFTSVVPCFPSDSGLVRVVAFDPNLNAGVDTSDSLFILSDPIFPQVTLNFPNGGEILQAGDVDTVRWVATDNCGVDFLNLFLSTDGGTSWDTISTREANDSTYLWLVPNLPSNGCLLRIIAYDLEPNSDEDTSDAFFTILPVGVEEGTNENPETSSGAKFKLYQNNPNPFHSTTVIQYQIPNRESVIARDEAIPVRLEIYDITGKLVEILVDERQEPGVYHLVISNHQLPSSGIYFLRLETSESHLVRKMILLR